MSVPRQAIFVRPNMGFGGSEQWAVDAARALQADGWTVRICVNDFEAGRAPREAVTGEISVEALGGIGPARHGGRFRVLRVLVNQWLLLRRLRAQGARPDLLVCDLVPHAVPWIRRWFPKAAVLVYCHYPDCLTVKNPRGLYGFYRRLIERRERLGMVLADRVVANSDFTAAAIRRAFPTLDGRRLAVVRPGVSTPTRPERAAETGERLLLTVARFAPSKNTELSVKAFVALRDRLEPGEFARCRLVLAGGYDGTVEESRALLQRLRASVKAAGLENHVEFRPNVPPGDLDVLWRRAFALVHPTAGEHFGIVPVEAMMHGLPVLAVNEGGPLETVVDGITGALRPATAEAFSEVMAGWIRSPATAVSLGQAGRARAEAAFRHERFAREFSAEAVIACAERSGGRP